MSALRAVLDRLNDIEATISRIEGNSSAENAFAYRLTLQSLENRREGLREELAEVTRREFIEVCDYRIIPENSISYALNAVTGALHDFQDLVTLLFDADPAKPKQRGRVDATAVERTRFNFGFSYAGSLGVVLTIPNERLIAVDSDLDAAVRAAFELMSAKTTEDIKNAAARFGTPAVRKLYSWSKTQRDYGLSAEIKWIREREVRFGAFVQARESTEVCRLIENRSDTTVERLSVVATLVKWDLPRRKFTLEMPEDVLISGNFSKELDASVPRIVASRYKAQLVKETVTHYAADKEEVSWSLAALDNLK